MTTCPKCGAKLEPDWRFCMNCSTPVESSPIQPPTAVNSPAASRPVAAGPGFGHYSSPPAPITLTVEPKFPVLRFVAKLLKVLAVVQIVGAIILGISIASASSPAPGFGAAGGGLSALVGGGGFLIAVTLGLLGGLYSWAAAEIIMVALAVEENTRAMRLSIK